MSGYSTRTSQHWYIGAEPSAWRLAPGCHRATWASLPETQLFGDLANFQRVTNFGYVRVLCCLLGNSLPSDLMCEAISAAVLSHIYSFLARPDIIGTCTSSHEICWREGYQSLRNTCGLLATPNMLEGYLRILIPHPGYHSILFSRFIRDQYKHVTQEKTARWGWGWG